MENEIKSATRQNDNNENNTESQSREPRSNGNVSIKQENKNSEQNNTNDANQENSDEGMDRTYAAIRHKRHLAVVNANKTSRKYIEAIKKYNPNDTAIQEAEMWDYVDDEYNRIGRF